MAKVYVLPGVTRHEFIGRGPTADELIARASERGVTDLMVIGTLPSGDLYFDATENNIDRVIGRLTRAAALLATEDIDHDYVVDTEKTDAVESE